MSAPAANSRDFEQTRWFAEQVQPHEPELRAYLRGRFPDLNGHIDDLVQEAYSRILRAQKEGKVGQPRAYLFVTARNAALDLFRRNRFVTGAGLEEKDPSGVVEDRPDAAETASREQEIQILNDAIRSLPDRCREVLVLRRFHALSYREIAERLGISENTVNAQLAIAMARCRDYLDARGVLKKTAHANDRAH